MTYKTKILLTGASGTVGSNVLQQLAENQEIDLTVFDLKTSKAQKTFAPFAQKTHIIYGDITNFKSIEAACSDKDVVIHLAAIIPPASNENPTLAYKVNVEGTQNLVRGVEAKSPNAFFLYASSVAIYGDWVKNPYINVGDPIQPSEGDEYALTKMKAEQFIRDSQLDWSVFRLCAIMGIGNHKVSGLMFEMPLDTCIEIASPEDTARAFNHAATQSNKRNLLSKKIFNLGGGTNFRMIYKDFLALNFDIFGLGEVNFLPYVFAEKNSHCGYYQDGDDLEKILHFRRDSIDTYTQKLKKATPAFQRMATKLVKSIVKKQLLKKSEPYQAYQAKDATLLKRFFDSV